MDGDIARFHMTIYGHYSIYGHVKTCDISGREHASNFISFSIPIIIHVEHDYEVRNTIRRFVWPVWKMFTFSCKFQLCLLVKQIPPGSTPEFDCNPIFFLLQLVLAKKATYERGPNWKLVHHSTLMYIGICMYIILYIIW